MKIEAVINRESLLKKSRVATKIPFELFLSFIIMLLGITTGVILCSLGSFSFSGKAAQFILNFASDFSNKTFFEVFSGMMLTFVPYCFFVFVFALGVLGSFPILAANFIQAFILSCTVTQIIKSNALRGLEYFLLMMLAGKTIFLFSMLLMSETAIKSTHQIKGIVQKESGEKFNTGLFLKKIGFIILLFVLSAFVECCCVKIFSSLFETAA